MFRISLYITIIFIFTIINTVIIEGYDVTKLHNSSIDVDFDEPVSRKVLSKFIEEHMKDYKTSKGSILDIEIHRRDPSSNRSLTTLSEGSDLETFDRYNSDRKDPNFGPLRENEGRPKRLGRSLSKYQTRRKRHYKNKVVVVGRMTKEDHADMVKSDEQNKKWLQRMQIRDLYRNKTFYVEILRPEVEVEVTKVHNTSICDYTVVPVPDPTGTRIPKDLKHVICNKCGEPCYKTGLHTCTQTYSNIDVMYGNGTKEVIKLYMGCVCTMSYYNGIYYLPSSSRLT